MISLNEQKILQILNQDKKLFLPLEVNFNIPEQDITNKKISKPDLRVTVNFQEKNFIFISEIINVTYPKQVNVAINQIKNFNLQKQYYPALIVPYITPAIFEMIKDSNTNTFDLNGNYYINTPELLAIRLDKNNQYPEKRTIQNVFAGDSSIVCRYLLAYPKSYTKITEIYQGIESAGGKIVLSTVSKVLKILEEEMIIYKDKKRINLLQPEKLLNLLRDNYEKPGIKDTLRIKIDTDNLPELLNQNFGVDNWIYSGTNSAFLYTTALKEKQCIIYTKKNIFDKISLQNYEDKRFYNCEIIETDSKFVFFNTEDYYASEIQAYLELSQLDKREKEIAQNIFNNIIWRVKNE